MASVSLNHLQTFYLVAKHGSYSAAARLLNISYQSAANHIRRLEQMFRDELVVSERGSRAVKLTPRGQSLFRLLEPELDIMFNRLSEVIGMQRPLLRIGMPQAVLFYLFPRALAAFQKEYPDVHLLTFERDTVLADLLTAGSLDVAITERFFGEALISQRVIGEFGLSLVLPEGWPRPARLADVPAWAIERPFVTYEPGQMLRNLSLDYLSLGGRTPEVVMSVSSTGCVKRYIANGTGFSVIPSWSLEASDRGLQIMPLTDIPPVKLYFCQAQFLGDNVYVKALFRACETMLADAD
jgi:molybdate transport repressor ModE-like protein